MTVCLAGVYENGKGAICVADKMTTYRNTDHEEISFERPEVIKIFKLTPTTAILVSGSSVFAKELIREVKKKLKPTYGTQRVTDVLKDTYALLQIKHAFYDILMPLGYRSYDHFNRLNIPVFDRNSLTMKLSQYDLGVDAIIVGKNPDGRYEVDHFERGSVVPCDEGFWSIGSGGWHAMRVLGQSYHKDASREEAEHVLRDAKKEAEQDDHVGKGTPDVEYLE